MDYPAGYVKTVGLPLSIPSALAPILTVRER